jgi:hypothetical protein
MHSPKPSTHVFEPMRSSSRRPTANRSPVGFNDKSNPWAPPHKPRDMETCRPAPNRADPPLRSLPAFDAFHTGAVFKNPGATPSQSSMADRNLSRVTGHRRTRTVPTKARTTGLPEPGCGRLRLPHLRPQPPTPGPHAAPGPFPLHIPSGPATVATSSQREIAYVFRRGLLPRALGSSIRRHT